MSKDFDFGFSIVEEKDLDIVRDLEQIQQMADQQIQQMHNKELLKVENRLAALHNAIMPLLNNLAMNPSCDYIKWNGADRIQKIEDFKKLIDEIENGE